MKKKIFIKSNNKMSNRWAFFEDNGESAWLYLCSPNSTNPEKDIFVYSPIEPIINLNKNCLKNGIPPTLTKEFASEVAVIESASENDLKIIWAENGDSVAIAYKKDPIAMITIENQLGYSKALSKDSPFGNKWCDLKFKEQFKKFC